jgi:hypothetical protein
MKKLSRTKSGKEYFSKLESHIIEIDPNIHFYPEFILYLQDLVTHIHFKGKKFLVSQFQENVKYLDLSKVKSKQIDFLRKKIRDWIELYPLSSKTPNLLAILSQLYNKKDIPLIQKYLSVYLNSSKSMLAGVGQGIIALSNLGERIISDGSYAFDEYEKNISDAEKYLQKTMK